MENTNKIRVLIAEPNKTAEIATIDNTLEAMQEIVGGQIEAFQIPPCMDPVSIVCNEDGKMMNPPLRANRHLPDGRGGIADIICGTFIVCGTKDDDFVSLNDAMVQKYMELYESPEIFFRDGNNIRFVKGKA